VVLEEPNPSVYDNLQTYDEVYDVSRRNRETNALKDKD
jgi:hypothetical protein